MKSRISRNGVLGAVALASLTIYILACTSFSPDDKKVLYPAFDNASGTIGMAVYDRDARRSEMVFVPMPISGKTQSKVSNLVRAQWLADGRQILVAWAASEEDTLMNYCLVPFGDRGPIRIYQVPETKQGFQNLTAPVCMAGNRVLLNRTEDEVVLLDLKTGIATTKEFTNSISLFADPSGEGAFYAENLDTHGEQTVFGRIAPDTFARTPLMTFTNQVADFSFIAYDRRGRTLAFMEEDGNVRRLVVLRQGQPPTTRVLDFKPKPPRFSMGGLTANGKVLWTTYAQETSSNGTEFGFMEIPLAGTDVRKTPLLTLDSDMDDEAALYFQGAVSHDGRTAAVASTYLAVAAEEFKRADSALYLVDLSDPKRKVTKVPIPIPPKPAGSDGE